MKCNEDNSGNCSITPHQMYKSPCYMVTFVLFYFISFPPPSSVYLTLNEGYGNIMTYILIWHLFLDPAMAFVEPNSDVGNRREATFHRFLPFFNIIVSFTKKKKKKIPPKLYFFISLLFRSNGSNSN